MQKLIHRFFYAWLFLTKLPAVPLPKARDKDWGRITPYFVLIGFIIGFILLLISILFLSLKLPIIFSALLVLLIWYLITGCLHLDGLMDTFDGINCQDSERKVEAMKDSRIGAFGAIAGIFIILFKLTTLYTILTNKLLFILIISVPIARLVVVYSFTFLNQNQKSGTSSSLILAGIKKPMDLIVNLFVFIVFLSALIFFFPPPSSILSLIMFIFICMFLSISWAHWLDAHFKGHTGDTFGALVELSETTVLCLGVIFKNYLV